LSKKGELRKVRTEINEHTIEIFRLIAKRFELGLEAGDLKNSLGLPIIDIEREKKLEKIIKKEAKIIGMDEKTAKQFLRLLIKHTRNKEIENIRINTIESQMKKNRRVSIVGGTGRMGQWFTLYFKNMGYEVEIIGKNKRKVAKIAKYFRVNYSTSINDSINKSDIILVSVPMKATTPIISEVLEHVKEDKIILEISSLKKNIERDINKKFKKHKDNIISIHPLFGPGLDINSKQQIILIKSNKTNKQKRIVTQLFPKSNITIINAKDHDKSMAYILSLTHFINILFLSMLKKQNNIDYFSTTFKIQYNLANAILNDRTELLADIQILNKDFNKVLNNFIKDSKEFQKIINKKQDKELVKNIDSIKNNYKNLKSFKESYELIYDIL
jgi:prephenate dehydrogenase|tara:strand:- start:231 stop:1388 length:1158 start_codon:yes stop_codon:yes gene_type:complete